ncbi:MAG: hypothetical protein FWF76_00855 [Oscillospiraceae bacterium]|nr:hypothetical protein [Oscillospiraceae bacterium]
MISITDSAFSVSSISPFAVGAILGAVPIERLEPNHQIADDELNQAGERLLELMEEYSHCDEITAMLERFKEETIDELTGYNPDIQPEEYAQIAPFSSVSRWQCDMVSRVRQIHECSCNDDERPSNGCEHLVRPRLCGAI